MLKKIALKNPGCQFCRYYLPSFLYHGQATPGACIQKARQVFQSNVEKGKKNWKWVNCAIPEERNREKTCDGFKIRVFWSEIFFHVTMWYRKAGEQYPPAFSGEKYWKT